MKINFVQFFLCFATVAVVSVSAIKQSNRGLAQTDAEIETGNPYEANVDKILDTTKEVLDSIYDVSTAGMTKAGELKKKMLEPVKPVTDKITKFTKDREKDT